MTKPALESQAKRVLNAAGRNGRTEDTAEVSLRKDVVTTARRPRGRPRKKRKADEECNTSQQLAFKRRSSATGNTSDHGRTGRGRRRYRTSDTRLNVAAALPNQPSDVLDFHTVPYASRDLDPKTGVPIGSVVQTLAGREEWETISHELLHVCNEAARRRAIQKSPLRKTYSKPLSHA